MTTNKNDIIIIGGGIIGLACAHYLMNQGTNVTIIEDQQIGSGASHGNCGLLFFSDVITLCAPGVVSTEIIRTLRGTSPLFIKPELDMDRIAFLLRFALNCRKHHMNRAAKDKYALLSYSDRLFRQLLDTGILACDFEDKGVLTAYLSKKAFDGFHRTNRFLEQYGFGYKKLSRQQTLNFEPALSSKVVGSWFSKHDRHARPDLLVAAWKNDLLRRGMKIKEMCRATDFVCKQGTIQGVQTNQGPLFADAFVLAAGAFCSKLAKTLKLCLPIQPGKGYSITMHRPEICPAVPCMLHERNMVVTPWKSGYRLGGTMEFSGFSTDLNRTRLNKLIQGAAEYMRTPMGRPIVEEWAGVRPMTYDDMPVIGRTSGFSNLVVAAGHGMLGLTLATGTGKLVSDLILEKPPEIDPAPFSPERFN
ncbi:FAD-dependent oxidoreductase [uncultured Desulfobacter sp.]|uniref:NAD(P)/FAD-dependent oxidoreductase n=1 Tax=uncultured Desulfobacter sp. TaxID=240139 RepID=UPI002AA6377C|nr:FAD-dependent oxidoreductase [uncultured Desulfobacter sp.]